MNSLCISDKKVRAVIIDARINRDIEENLAGMGIEAIKTVRHPSLYTAISYHPDIVLCPVGGGRIVAAPEMYEFYKKALACYRVKLIKGDTVLSGNYPFNIAYNIASVGNKAILYSRYADPVVMRELINNIVEFIEVKQGYAKCSTAVVNENALITSDKGIAHKAGQRGIDVLLIRSGYIQLEGFDYGFIGGCCGRISEDSIAFAGDISFHPDGEEIRKFLEKHYIYPVCLYSGPLIDVGSILPVVEIY